MLTLHRHVAKWSPPFAVGAVWMDDHTIPLPHILWLYRAHPEAALRVCTILAPDSDATAFVREQVDALPYSNEHAAWWRCHDIAEALAELAKPFPEPAVRAAIEASFHEDP